MSVLGKLPPPLNITESSEGGSNWRVWKQLWEAYEVLSDWKSKESAFQVSVFISCIGTEGIQVMNSLPFKSESDRQKVAEILKLLDGHFLGEENVAYERFQFYSRKLAADEPVDKFISDFRTLARFLQFCRGWTKFQSSNDSR